MLTPLHLKLLLHAYRNRDSWPFFNQLIQDELDALQHSLGLITPVDEDWQWETTARGDAHVRQLLALPLPEKAWVGADGRVIEA